MGVTFNDNKDEVVLEVKKETKSTEKEQLTTKSEVPEAKTITDVLKTTPSIEEPKLDLSNYIQVKEIPSNFLSYPNKSEVYYKGYTFQDLKDLANPNLSLVDQFYVILKGIETVGFKKDDLTYFDFLYLGLLRRLLTLKTNTFEVSYYCRKCNEHLMHRFNHSDLGFKVLLDDYKDKDIKLPLTIEFESINRELSFFPITVSSYLRLLRTGEIYRHRDNGQLMLDDDSDPVRDEVAIYASMCTLPFEEAYKLISNITDPDEIELIEEIDKIFDHGVEPLEFECKNTIGEPHPTHPKMGEKCNQKNIVSLMGVETLIIPFRPDKKPLSSRIKFG